MMYRLKWYLRLALLALIGCGTISNPPASLVSPSSDAGSPSGDTANDWQAQVADDGPLFAGDLSVIVDAEQVPHVAYSVSAQGRNLRHAWREGSGFVSEFVDEYGRGFSKSWVRNSNDLRLLYDGLMYSSVAFHASRDAAGSWNVDILNSIADSGAASAAWVADRLLVAQVTAVRGTDFPGYEGRFIVRQGVALDGQVIAEEHTRLSGEGVPPLVAMGVDSRGSVHIAYSMPDDDFERYLPAGDFTVPLTIRYVRITDGEWSTPELLSPETGYYGGLSMAIDAEDSVHITFEQRSPYLAPAGLHRMVYLRRAPEASLWASEFITDGRGGLARGSMAVDGAGTVHVVYCTILEGDSRCHGVNHARRRDGLWSTEAIQAVESCARFGDPAAPLLLGTAATLALAGDGTVHVAYAGCERELIYAHAVPR
jgi:hypothetical protein